MLNLRECQEWFESCGQYLMHVPCIGGARYVVCTKDNALGFIFKLTKELSVRQLNNLINKGGVYSYEKTT